MDQPFLRDVSIREAASYDLVSFLTGILFAFVILCLILAIIYVEWLGGPSMQESRSEILLGFLLFTGVVVAVLRFRASGITEVLRNGHVVPGEVLRGFQYQYIVNLLVKYTVQGEVIQKHVWLPSTKRPRALIKEEKVFLSVRLDKPKVIVVRDSYMK